MSLIWYEQFGSDSKRTLLNMLVSGLAWSMMEYLMFISGSDIFRYYYGNMPHTVCVLRTTLQGSLLLQLLLFVTAIVVTKYVFIFHLRNPTALDDKFWILFVNMWIRKFAYLTQIISTLLPGKNNFKAFYFLKYFVLKTFMDYQSYDLWISGNEPLIFYLCSGETPKSLGSSSLKLKNVQITVGFATFINIVLIVRIQWKKITTSGSANQTKIHNLREFASYSHNMSDIVTVIITTSVFLITVLFISYLSIVKPEILNTFPHSTLLHAFRLVWPMALTFIFFFTHFLKHQNFRRLWKESIFRFFCRYVKSREIILE